MTLFEKLENEILLDISLHKQLKKLVVKELCLFSKNEINDLTEETEQRRRVETEIEETNETIAALFRLIKAGEITVNDTQKKTLSLMLGELHESVNNTMNTVDQTWKILQKMKKETLNELKMFGKRKEALNVYTRGN